MLDWIYHTEKPTSAPNNDVVRRFNQLKSINQFPYCFPSTEFPVLIIFPENLTLSSDRLLAVIIPELAPQGREYISKGGINMPLVISKLLDAFDIGKRLDIFL